MKVRELLEQRAAKLGRMQAITAKAEAENRDLADDEKREFDALKTEVEGLNGRITRAEEVRSLERAAAPAANDATDRSWQGLLARHSISKAIMAGSAEALTGLEQEVHAELERRRGRPARGVMVPLYERRSADRETRAVGQFANFAAAGGVLVPGQYRGEELIGPLLPSTILERAGARVLTGLRGAVVIPRKLSTSAVQWVAENEEHVVSQLYFSSITLTPRTAAATVRYSRSLLINASPDIDTLVKDDLREQMALAVEDAAITGSGTGPEPTGLLNQPGLPEHDLSGASYAASWDAVVSLRAKPAVANVASGNLTFVSNAKVEATLSKTPIAPDGETMILGDDGRLAGRPFLMSNLVPSNLDPGGNKSPLIYGDFSSMIIGLYSGVDLLTNPFTEAMRANVLVHCYQDVDVGIRHLEAFAIAKLATTL